MMASFMQNVVDVYRHHTEELRSVATGGNDSEHGKSLEEMVAEWRSVGASVSRSPHVHPFP